MHIHYSLCLVVVLGCGDVSGPKTAPDAPETTPDALVTPDAPAGHFYAAAEFSATLNPSGVWTFGYAPTLAAPLIAYTSTYAPGNVEVGAFWSAPELGDNSPHAWRNESSASAFGVPAGSLSLHPGKSGEFSVARFTAPASARYAGTIELADGDFGATEATVLIDGATAFSMPITSVHSVPIPVVMLQAGHTIELWVGSAGAWEGDNTPFAFQVQVVL